MAQSASRFSIAYIAQATQKTGAVVQNASVFKRPKDFETFDTLKLYSFIFGR